MPTKRSRSVRFGIGSHVLLPSDREEQFIPQIPFSTLSGTWNIESWTFGPGTVIWKIWPAVVLHTLFAVAVTIFGTKVDFGLGLAMPDVVMNVLGNGFSPT